MADSVTVRTSMKCKAEELRMGKPKWYDEDWSANHPDPKKIVCKDCFHREPDRNLGGTVIKGCTLATCGAFASKPTGILFDGDECPYYLDEKED